MSENNLKGLNDILFDQLRRLNTVEPGEKMDQEVVRAETMAKVAKPIVESASLVLEATKLKAEYSGLNTRVELPPMLEANKNG